MPTSVSGIPRRFVSVNVTHVQGWGNKWVGLRDAGIENANRDVFTYRRSDSLSKIRCPFCLFGVGPTHKLPRSILGAAQFGNQTAIEERPAHRGDIRIDQTDLTVRKVEARLLDLQFEAAGY